MHQNQYESRNYKSRSQYDDYDHHQRSYMRRKQDDSHYVDYNPHSNAYHQSEQPHIRQHRYQRARHHQPQSRASNAIKYDSHSYNHQPRYKQQHEPHYEFVSHDLHPSQQKQYFTAKEKTISSFNVNLVLNAPNSIKRPKIYFKHVVYYHTDPPNNVLQFNKDIKPIEIRAHDVNALQNMDLNEIAIDYSKVRNSSKQKRWQRAYSLSQKLPPKDCWDTSRIDPFCHEIHVIDKQISYYQSRTRFITYRHNLRAIANVVLFKLINMRIYDKCGINIGIHRRENDIFLENITEMDEKSDTMKLNANCLYGYLLEHTLESLSKQKHTTKDIQAMNFQKVCLERDEIRALNQIQIDNNVTVLFAAEMDAIMKDEFGRTQVIELKSSKVQTGYWRNRSKIADIPDFKLLKYWTQCFFGGVDSVIIAFHEKGVIQKTRVLKTGEIEAMFPVITTKCILMVNEILKWLQDTVTKLPENKPYLLTFDTNASNTEFVLKCLPKNTETKVSQMLLESLVSNKKEKDKLFNHGLIMNANTKQLEVKQILHKN